MSSSQDWLRPGAASGRGKSGPPRLRDSQRIRRRRALAGITLGVLGLVLLLAGVLTARVEAPPLVEVASHGVTEVPQTHFFQQPWVLFGNVDDPRRVPELAEIGCRPLGSLSLQDQPDDMTTFGSRVVDDEPIHALSLLSRSGEDAAIECTRAGSHAPLRLMPASEAPTLTPTAITILAFVLMVVGALVHPATIELRLRKDRDPRAGRA